MAVTTSNIVVKSVDKIPAAKCIQSKHIMDISPSTKIATVSPAATTVDQILFLRAENKILRESLQAIEETAMENLRKSFDVVWFARNRCCFPNHEASKRIENADEYKEVLELLRGNNGDFHFGFNSGLLAASRMFKEHADISDLKLDSIRLQEVWHDEVYDKIMKYKNKIHESKISFPNLDIEKFPQEK